MSEGDGKVKSLESRVATLEMYFKVVGLVTIILGTAGIWGAKAVSDATEKVIAAKEEARTLQQQATQLAAGYGALGSPDGLRAQINTEVRREAQVAVGMAIQPEVQAVVEAAVRSAQKAQNTQNASKDYLKTGDIVSLQFRHGGLFIGATEGKGVVNTEGSPGEPRKGANIHEFFFIRREIPPK